LDKLYQKYKFFQFQVFNSSAITPVLEEWHWSTGTSHVSAWAPTALMCLHHVQTLPTWHMTPYLLVPFPYLPAQPLSIRMLSPE